MYKLSEAGGESTVDPQSVTKCWPLISTISISQHTNNKHLSRHGIYGRPNGGATDRYEDRIPSP